MHAVYNSAATDFSKVELQVHISNKIDVGFHFEMQQNVQ